MKSEIMRILTLTIVLAGCLMVSCRSTHSRQARPEAVATAFLNHLQHFEFDEAKKLGTGNTARMVDMLKGLMELGKQKGFSDQFIPQHDAIQVQRTAIKGKNAVITYLDGSGKAQQIILVKEDGKWLVDMKKEMPVTGN